MPFEWFFAVVLKVFDSLSQGVWVIFDEWLITDNYLRFTWVDHQKCQLFSGMEIHLSVQGCSPMNAQGLFLVKVIVYIICIAYLLSKC
jgi:hypothetical protein